MPINTDYQDIQGKISPELPMTEFTLNFLCKVPYWYLHSEITTVQVHGWYF
jgi:hypothetical protein